MMHMHGDHLHHLRYRSLSHVHLTNDGARETKLGNSGNSRTPANQRVRCHVTGSPELQRLHAMDVLTA